LLPQTQQLIDKIRSGEDDLSELGVINMLNTKYFLAGNTRDAVLENNFAYGNAWFVDRVQFVNNSDEEIEALVNADLKRTAVVDQSKFEVEAFDTDSSRTIGLTSYTPNRLTYESNSDSENLAVFSEIYYPIGWKAFIDDKPTEIIRANFVLRALEIPAGNHTIEFRFEPKAYYSGNNITLIGNLLVLVILLGTFGIEIRNNFVSSKHMDGE
jgi:hypothetical protein